jgi:predicted enzyme related to lactoylglutathione lyase
MNDELIIKMYSFTMDSKDPHELAKFYAELLRWETLSIDEEYAIAYPSGTHQGSYPGIMFQRNLEYKPPVWPQKPEDQQQMAHIDFAVNDLERAVQYAIHCGAKIAEAQFSDNWTVMLDPAGHPFCLCEMKHIIESANFALL